MMRIKFSYLKKSLIFFVIGSKILNGMEIEEPKYDQFLSFTISPVNLGRDLVAAPTIGLYLGEKIISYTPGLEEGAKEGFWSIKECSRKVVTTISDLRILNLDSFIDSESGVKLSDWLRLVGYSELIPLLSGVEFFARTFLNTWSETSISILIEKRYWPRLFEESCHDGLKSSIPWEYGAYMARKMRVVKDFCLARNRRESVFSTLDYGIFEHILKWSQLPLPHDRNPRLSERLQSIRDAFANIRE